ncbi:hypothetical protein JRO89_XS11G0159300 [Xanthoceras sorbifolium]|uniref:Cytochrome P450 n=1 Tax=Xanthoceras sorbifolium TaxID=99658 RepID=A0ABQ8HFQ3_9ROSI|nr:hypothetical protein JRO89_XS11G0159300 [Xanthoceras sorbifolium]
MLGRSRNHFQVFHHYHQVHQACPYSATSFFYTAAVVSTYGGIDIAWSSNGPEWRKLRKIFIQELMNKTSLDACHALRPQEIREMVKDLYAKVGSPINIGDQMFLTLLNVIMRCLWGWGGGGGGGGGGGWWGLGSLHKEDKSRVGIQFRQMVGEFIELWGAPNISDLFPVLARFDLQGVESKMKKTLIVRDPVAWESPLEFQPERFLRDDDGKCEYKGNNFNLLPFGSGRRMCAGIPMAENDPSCIGYLVASF